MATYNVRLDGESPLLMHWDNLEWVQKVEKWQKAPENKSNSVAGDDRSPGWRWIGNLYVDSGKVVIPSDNLMTNIREGGAKVPKLNGKSSETYKKYTQSCLLVNEVAWPLLVDGREIDITQLFEELKTETDFDVHVEKAREYGIDLFAKRAKIGQSKHVRVRPRFDRWAAEGTITVLDDQQIPFKKLKEILEHSGSLCGIGDWRPSSPKSPGSFGRFSVQVTPM